MKISNAIYIPAPLLIKPSRGDLGQEPERGNSFEDTQENKDIYFETLTLRKDEKHPSYVAKSLSELSDDAESQKTADTNSSYIASIILDKIKEVKQGNFTLKSLNGTNRTTKPLPIFAKDEIESVLHTNYLKTSDGYIEMINKTHLKKQKKVLGFLIKQFGSAILSGKSINSLSLPVSIFEPRSHLERQSNGFIYAPHFLNKAAQTKDTLEQFRLSVTYFISSLHILINPQKPFNPILGETFQANINDCEVFAEQISHHPPVSAFQVVGKGFNIDAVLEFTAALSANSVKSSKVGLPKITFKNNNTIVRAQYPSGVMQGTAIGRRTFNFSDKFYIFDLENKYYAEVDFNQSSGSFLKKNKNSKDTFTGAIYRVNDYFVQKLKEDITKNKKVTLKFKEKEHAVTTIDTIQGKWLEYLQIGNKTTWVFGQPWPYKLQYIDNPLPSDANYRLDILYLRTGNEVKSQEHKKILEEFQRNDLKLREQYRGKTYK